MRQTSALWLSPAFGLGLMLGCWPSGSRSDGSEQQAPEQPPACREPEGRAVVLAFPGQTCPWVLDVDENRARLELMGRTASTPLAGILPEVCTNKPCVWHGAESAIGPVVLAVPVSAQSEMGDGAYLGVGAGQALAFIDLWAGAGVNVMDEFTDLGPAHALVPYVCEGQLALRVQARLPAGEGQRPTPELAEREGVYAVVDGAWERRGPWPAQDACTAIGLSMP